MPHQENAMLFKLTATQSPGRIVVSNTCWEVVHEAGQGGCIGSIRFPHCLNRNILHAPICTLAQMHRFGCWTREDYRDCRDRDAALELAVSRPDYVEVRSRAEFKDRDGASTGMHVETVYRYHPGHCKVERHYRFDGDTPLINRFSVVQLEAIPEIDRWMARPSPITNIVQETAKNWFSMAHYPGPCQWGRFESYEAPFKDWHIPLQLSLYRRDGEAVEIMVDSDYDNWLHAFDPRPDCTHYSFVRRDYDPDCNVIGMEPFFGAEDGRRLHPAGDCHFGFYVNLPNNPANGPSRRWQRSWPVLRFRQGRHWATEDEVRRMAENGIQYVLHHHDSPNGRGAWPDGSFFWPDGVVDPYSAEEKANLLEVIGWVHKYGMKIIPYFNPFELHPRCRQFEAHRYEWGRYCRGQFRVNRTDGGIYGVSCCMRSGYGQFLKEYVAAVVKTYGFDGCYFDGLAGNYCEHPAHDHGRVHMSTDEMFDLVQFARGLAGPEGLVVLHNTGAASVGLENYCDCGIAAEDFSGCPNFNSTVPATGHWGEIFRYGNHIARTACVWSAIGAGHPDHARQLLRATTRAHLEGFTFYGTPYFQDQSVSQEPYFRLSRMMKGLDFSSLRFYSACVEKPAGASNPKIRTALYRTDTEAILVLGNADDVEPNETGFHLDLPFRIAEDEHGRPCRNGDRVVIPGCDFALIHYSMQDARAASSSIGGEKAPAVTLADTD